MISTHHAVAVAAVALGLAALPGLASLAPDQSVPVAQMEVDNPAPPQSEVLAVYDAISGNVSADEVDQPFCEAAADLSDRLSLNYLESPVASQTQDDHTRLDLWASISADSWSLVYVRADGMACVIDSGLGWKDQVPASQLFSAALGQS